MPAPQSWTMHGEVIPNFAYLHTNKTIKAGLWEDPDVWSGGVPTPSDTLWIEHSVKIKDERTAIDIWVSPLGGIEFTNGGKLNMRNLQYEGWIGGNPDEGAIVFRDMERAPNDPRGHGTTLMGLPGSAFEIKGPHVAKSFKSTVDIPAGATQIQLPGADLSSWKIADLIYLGDMREANKDTIGGTHWHGAGGSFIRDTHQNECVNITAINGDTITVTPTVYAHRAWKDEGVVVGNLSRRFFISSVSDVRERRGDVVWMGTAKMVPQNIEVFNTGRTDGLRDTNETDNIKAHYGGFHAHHVRGPAGGAYDHPTYGRQQWMVSGCSIHHCNAMSGMTVHDTSDGLLIDSVIAFVDGIGCWEEDGNEVRNRYCNNLFGYVDGKDFGRYDTTWKRNGIQLATRNGWHHEHDNVFVGGVVGNFAHASVMYTSDDFPKAELWRQIAEMPGEAPSGPEVLMNTIGNEGFHVDNNKAFGPYKDAFSVWNLNAAKQTVFHEEAKSFNFGTYKSYGAKNCMVIYSGTDYHINEVWNYREDQRFWYSGALAISGDDVIGTVTIGRVHGENCNAMVPPMQSQTLEGEGFFVGRVSGEGNDVVCAFTSLGTNRYGVRYPTNNYFGKIDEGCATLIFVEATNSVKTSKRANLVSERRIIVRDYMGQSYRWYMPSSAPSEKVPLWTPHNGDPPPEWNDEGQYVTERYIHGIDRAAAQEMTGLADTEPTNQQVADWIEGNLYEVVPGDFPYVAPRNGAMIPPSATLLPGSDGAWEPIDLGSSSSEEESSSTASPSSSSDHSSSSSSSPDSPSSSSSSSSSSLPDGSSSTESSTQSETGWKEEVSLLLDEINQMTDTIKQIIDGV